MSYNTKASDWEVAGLGGIAGGIGVAGGWFYFMFKSQSADVSCGCSFIGLGFGGGFDFGNIGKSLRLINSAPKIEKLFTALSYPSAAAASYTSIQVDEPFSLNDLHNKVGRLTMGTVAPVYGYTLMYITGGASTFKNHYFTNEACHGWGYGAGAAAMTTVGKWLNRH